MSKAQASALDRCLRRIDIAMAALEEIDDAKARAVAQALLEAVLDLHGLGLAKAITIAQSGADGDAISKRLSDDDHVSAILLLHGLHPEEAEVRLRKKIAAMRPHWGVCGFRIELLAVGGGEARALVRWSDDGEARADRSALLSEVEQALTDAAPDIDRIVLEQCEAAAATPTAPIRA
jgi:hypothetical protein